MKLNQAPNLNILWGQLIVEELRRSGVDYFCLAPGSRSSPLAIAVANSGARTLVHFDERGLCFHALGYSSATRKPCAVIVTSGTAGANCFPAIIEASKKKVPLIIITADRPPELQQTGALQTIDQHNLFGEFVRCHLELPCPTEEINPAFVLTSIDQAVFRATSHIPGPVHINCLFREPLAPVKATKTLDENYLKSINAWTDADQPFTSYIRARKKFSNDDFNDVRQRIDGIHNGIIVVGKLADKADQDAVLKLAEHLSWPIFADITSGLRLGSTAPNVIHHFDQLLLSKKLRAELHDLHQVNGVIHLGGRMTSKRWYDFVQDLTLKEYVMVLNHPLRSDPCHIVTCRMEGKVGDFCEQTIRSTRPRAQSQFGNSIEQLSAVAAQTITNHFARAKELSEPLVANLISQHLPKGQGLFLANSMPLRDMDMYAAIRPDSVVIGANRGASGIDGIVASAVGFAAGLKQPVTLVIGDLALLHDLNSLDLVAKSKHPITVVVINNDGGGIFSFLPIAHFPKLLEPYFATPHGRDFAKAAELFGIKYQRPTTPKNFLSSYHTAVKSQESTLIEVTTVRDDNLRYHKHLQAELIRAIDTALQTIGKPHASHRRK